MGRGRPRTAIGTFGEFTYVTAPNGKVKARVRFRDDDGQLRLVQAAADLGHARPFGREKPGQLPRPLTLGESGDMPGGDLGLLAAIRRSGHLPRR